jgi:hypothetical protein
MTETDPVSKTLYFIVSRILDDGQSPKSLCLAMLPLSNQFQSILNVTIDTDDLKKELNSIPNTQQTVSYLSIILQ